MRSIESRRGNSSYVIKGDIHRQATGVSYNLCLAALYKHALQLTTYMKNGHEITLNVESTKYIRF